MVLIVLGISQTLMCYQGNLVIACDANNDFNCKMYENINSDHYNGHTNINKSDHDINRIMPFEASRNERTLWR